MRKLFLGILFFSITLIFANKPIYSLENNITITPTSSNPGTCLLKRVSVGQHAGDRPELENKCSQGYKPDVTNSGNVSICKCITEATQICQMKNSPCFLDLGCQEKDGQKLSGCATYVCRGAQGNRVKGVCIDTNTICSANYSTCQINEDCQKTNEPACADYTCHEITVGRQRVKQCLFGVQEPTPTPTSPLPPCAQWVYSYPTESPRFSSNGLKINDDVYNNPDFKERKCVAIQTGIGEISTEPQGFVKRIFSLVLGIAGGIALILIIISGYKMMASQGNPEALTASRDQLISAIVGLLFIIFSFVILEVIGVDILKIPGFSK